jgi:putative transposase
VARLPRLVVPGQAHYLIQRGHGMRAVFADAEDRRQYLGALLESARLEGVLLHAYALLDDEVQWLVTPADASALGRIVQAVGRRYGVYANRRHGGRGTLWDGRFRCAVLEAGAWRLAALRLVDSASSEPGMTSAAHRLDGTQVAPLSDPAEFWALGNTPFEREVAYRGLLAQPLPSVQRQALRDAALGGWALGSEAFLAHIGAAAARPAAPRPRGRPRLRPA